MHEKLKQLYLLRDQSSWGHYCREMTSWLASGQDPEAVSFAEEPRKFPCLVASIVRPADSSQASDFCKYTVNCCFVYPQDAVCLLDAAEQAEGITFSSDNGVTRPDSATGRSEAEPAEYSPTQTGVLLLALVNEMDAVGALNRDKLLSAVDWVNDWLQAKQAVNIEEVSLAGILRRMWEDKDAG